MIEFDEVLMKVFNKRLLELNGRILNEVRGVEDVVSKIIDKAFDGKYTDDIDELMRVLNVSKVKVNTDNENGHGYSRLRSVACSCCIEAYINLTSNENDLTIVRKDKNGKDIKMTHTLGDCTTKTPMKTYEEILTEVCDANAYLLTVIEHSFVDLLSKIIKNKLETKYSVSFPKKPIECEYSKDETGHINLFRVEFDLVIGKTNVTENVLNKMVINSKEDE